MMTSDVIPLGRWSAAVFLTIKRERSALGDTFMREALVGLLCIPNIDCIEIKLV